MLQKYLELDKLTPDGTFTVHSDVEWDMRALRDYCQMRNKKCSDLSDDEAERFIIKKSQSKSS